jgi:TonB family protein
MFDLNTLIPKTDRELPVAKPPSRHTQQPQQRRMMAIALTLLLFALALVLYHDRDFWFSDTPDAEEQPAPTSPPSRAATRTEPLKKKRHTSKPQPKNFASTADAPPATATAERTALPPLEVEVVAGNVHRKLHPSSNSIRVNLQPATPPQSAAEISTAAGAAAASVTSDAAERVQMSADAAEAVTHSVNPGYPMLARQMKVQGSVILQAMISRDGAIQDLQVLSGPPILASAAQEAVRQWHFRPHYQGLEAVETKARITVNFTISTN